MRRKQVAYTWDGETSTYNQKGLDFYKYSTELLYICISVSQVFFLFWS